MERFLLSPEGKIMALLGSSRKGGGAINLLDAYTLQWTSQIRIEGRGGIADFVWWADGAGMSIVAKTGEVTEYSLEAGVVARWNDQGAVGITTIALGGNSGHGAAAIGPDRWVAVGSSSGVVNIYDRKAWLDAAKTAAKQQQSHSIIPADPTPLRALDNLTTPISSLSFAPDGQLLAISSRWKKDALRLVHLPSATVYKNWPTGKTPLGRVTATAFGRVPVPGKGQDAGKPLVAEVLAVANEAGKIRLWEIRA